MPDISGMQIAAGAFGVVSVSALMVVMIQRVKEYVPWLHGRSAMAAVDAISLIVAALVLYQLDSDWATAGTWIALAMGTLSLGIIARAHYDSLYHEFVEESREPKAERRPERFLAEPRRPYMPPPTVWSNTPPPVTNAPAEEAEDEATERWKRPPS